MPMIIALMVLLLVSPALADPLAWKGEWPRTDFTRYSIDYKEIRSGGPPKDGIPAIDRPHFVNVSAVRGLPGTEPVIGLKLNGDARAYPLRILMWHEIVNDTVGTTPVAVTFCPLCNSGIVFDRRLEGRELDFGTTGKLRHSDLVMYDRQTESWWQQFVGEGIVGKMTGKKLKILPARLESFDQFRKRHPFGKVLVPENPRARDYGRNAYAGYDTLDRPWLYDGEMPDGIEPLARVVAVGDRAWSLALIREKGQLTDGDFRLRWNPGQNSALDSKTIAEGRDVGSVVVEMRRAEGWQDVPYHVAFAFAFHAFHPDAKITTR
ncbi:DUF3179 domain-containing protein [Magnetospira sp. QH-2]|uniref:DUF3179 domain-containing protein n=1 Tax=Magnetospira sp. (strain QH-2) TaxID=1288970 RepID=UPI0003E81B38|nr:DUF3179 domain-containing protein [Magnetospira sp. QH-2]CCQ73444.1 Conserved exported protein of unknown function [Magnetospira sp. QH-2]